MRLSLRSAFAAALLAVSTVFMACGDDSGSGPIAVATVSVTAEATQLQIGQTVQLDVTVRDASGNELDRSVTYESDAPTVASVTATGQVRALDDGTATITATADGVDGSITITVLPPPVALVTVTPTDPEIEVDGTVQLNATLEDIQGNELTGRNVSWSSSAQGVATVSGTGLVTGVSAGDAIITAASEGIEGSVTVTVSTAEFNPTEDTDVPAGTYDFETFTVPAGVTVTLLGDVEINVEGDATMEGTLEGDCPAFTLRSGGAVEMTGDVAMGCESASTNGGMIRIIASTDYTVGGSWTASGPVEITNNEALTDADFDDEFATSRIGPNQTGTGTCIVTQVEYTPTAKNPGANDPDDGQGGDGESGDTWTARCDGDVDFPGGTIINGQDGTHGGDGADDNDPDSDTAKGGDGGDGGTLKVQSTGSIIFGDGGSGGTTLNLSDGGDGGDAEKIASAPGQSAEAEAGHGGDAGTFEVTALGGITIGAGGLTINVGSGGDGGTAEAYAADGADAGANAAQAGGSASALAGHGGDSPKGRLRAKGNVTGLSNVVVNGGTAGWGGDATADAGNGGDGNETHPHGADGGDMSAFAGDGGDYTVEDQFGNLIGDGGWGGEASLAGGMGGLGWDGCSVDPPKAGGNGGDGGDGEGQGGEGGTGLVAGIDGDVTVAAGTGNGGDGGDGDGPGDGGMAGDDSGILGDASAGMEADARIDEGPNFEDGEDGDPCNIVEIEIEPISFVHEYAVSPCPQEIGSYVVTNNSDEPMDLFVSSSHPQVSFQAGGGATVQQDLITTVPAMSSVVITVYFNCQSTDDFTADVSIFVSQNDEEVGSGQATVAGDIQGAPGAEPGSGGGLQDDVPLREEELD